MYIHLQGTKTVKQRLQNQTQAKSTTTGDAPKKDQKTTEQTQASSVTEVLDISFLDMMKDMRNTVLTLQQTVEAQGKWMTNLSPRPPHTPQDLLQGPQVPTHQTLSSPLVSAQVASWPLHTIPQTLSL